MDSQNIPLETLKRRGSWVISVYLWDLPTREFATYLAQNLFVTFPNIELQKLDVSSEHNDMYTLDEGVLGSGKRLFLIVGHWLKIRPQNSKKA